MSSAAVAVVLGAAELGWLGQHEEHLRLGFNFQRHLVRSCISWRRYVNDVLVGSRVFCGSCIFVFMCACYPQPISLVSGAGTTIHTWVDVELRVVGQHVAVNIKNPSQSWVHNLGPLQKSTFLPWTGVLKGELGSIRGIVLGRLARTKMGLPEQFGVVCLLEDVVELVYMGYPCLLSGAWFAPCHAAVLPKLVAKPCEHGFLFARIEWCLMIRRIRGRSFDMEAARLTVVGLAAAEIPGGGIVVEAQ